MHELIITNEYSIHTDRIEISKLAHTHVTQMWQGFQHNTISSKRTKYVKSIN
jgi:hypothetical protein